MIYQRFFENYGASLCSAIFFGLSEIATCRQIKFSHVSVFAMLAQASLQRAAIHFKPFMNVFRERGSQRQRAGCPRKSASRCHIRGGRIDNNEVAS